MAPRRNYAFQFDLGYTSLRHRLSHWLRSGDSKRSQTPITDESLDQVAVMARCDAVTDRYRSTVTGAAGRLAA